MNRREFLQIASGCALFLVASASGVAKVLPTETKKGNDQVDRSPKAMEKRFLGGLNVSAIGLGCLPMVGYYGGHYNEDDMIKMIRHAYDAGVTFF